MARRRPLTDEESQAIYLAGRASLAFEEGGVVIDDVDPAKDPYARGDQQLRPRDPKRERRVRAFVTVPRLPLDAGGVLWLAYATVGPNADGKTVVSALSLEALLPRDAAVTVRVLQRFPVELLARKTLEAAEEKRQFDEWSQAYGLPSQLPAEEAARITRAAKKLGVEWAPPRGNRKTPRAFYDALAVEACQIAREERAVVPELMKRRKRPQSTIKRWLADARDVGALERGAWRLGPEYPAGREER
jgi:hypothetical protein